MSDSLWPHRLQHARLLYPPLSPRVCSDSCPWSQWCYLTFLSSASPLSFCLSLSQHQCLFQWVSSSHQVAKELELQLQHQGFQWIFRVDFLKSDWFDLLAVQGTLKSLLPGPQFENINSLATWWEELTHWKRHWCWERLRQEEKGTTEDEMVGWHHRLKGHEFE